MCLAFCTQRYFSFLSVSLVYIMKWLYFSVRISIAWQLRVFLIQKLLFFCWFLFCPVISMRRVFYCDGDQMGALCRQRKEHVKICASNAFKKKGFFVKKASVKITLFTREKIVLRHSWKKYISLFFHLKSVVRGYLMMLIMNIIMGAARSVLFF